MENKINIAELLKDCPKGMELDCTNYNGVVSLKGITNDNLYPIEIQVVYGNECNIHTLTKYGQTIKTPYNKCVIFPKGRTTWEGFQKPFEPGDIVITDNNEHAFIYSGENDSFWECYCGVYCGTRNICVNGRVWSGKSHNIRLATEEEKEKLFQVIKDNGYKWNAETKTLEKLIEPKFKVGDNIRIKGTSAIYVVTEIKEDCYMLDDKDTSLLFKTQGQWELVPNKFDITTLKPFDKVLARDTDNSMWTATLFSHLRGMAFYTVGGWCNQCIPFEGNEHLLGKTADCDEFYKNWWEV